MAKKRSYIDIVVEWNRSADFEDFCKRLQVDRDHGRAMALKAMGRGMKMKAMHMGESVWNPVFVDRIESSGHGTPTGAEAGSPEKIEVMRLRAENFQELFHPHDAAGVRSVN